MKSLNNWGTLLMAAFVLLGCARADNLGGSYVAADGNSLTMTLTESRDGVITGTLTEPGLRLPISGKRQGAGFAGMIGSPGNNQPYTATIQGKQLVLDIGSGEDAERITFSRAARAPTAAPAATSPQGQRPTSGTPGTRNVVINEQRLSDAEINQIEQTYQIRIEDANYWYDPILGAWGVKGWPTLGFIAPGLNLGGPLQSDASGGGTHVFVNGRELHPYDVMALQNITGPILPGRYFITGQGLAGYEGGPPMWNLAQMAAQTQRGGGGSHTWQSRITGASGFSDGTTGAVFLPNGGIVSTGQ